MPARAGRDYPSRMGAGYVVTRMITRKHLKRRKPKAKAAWFRDPEGEAPYRFWNGENWTAHTANTFTGPDPTIE